MTGNYGIMVFFVSIYVGVLLSTLSGSRETADFFLFGTLFNRFVCTLLAGLLVVVCQAVIFPNANRSADIMERTFRAFLEDLSYCVNVLINRYIRREELSDQEWVLINGIIEKYASTQQLQNWMSYEINLDQRYNMLYKSSRDEIEGLLASLRPLIALSLHPRVISLRPEDEDALRTAGKMLADALLEVEALFYEENTGTKINLYNTVQQLFEGPLRGYFFVSRLLDFTKALELLMLCALHETASRFGSRSSDTNR